MSGTVIGLELRGVSKGYPGGLVGIERVDLSIEAGGLLVLVGPSGAGKSTVMRSVAGLEGIDEGEIWLGGRRVDGLAPRDRGVALVFQNQTPYPYLSVFDNLAFGLRARGRPKPEIRDRVNEVASALRLLGLLGRRPSTLSGGEAQRVALGRALAARPSLLLLDEPFSNLDGPLRASARADLLEWQRLWNVTTLLVTHDQSEALAIGDRVALMNAGKVAQIGTPRELYDRPDSRFVGQFLGSPPMNVARVEVKIEGPSFHLRLLDSSPEASIRVSSLPGAPPRVESDAPFQMDLGFRPEHASLVEPAALDSTADRFLVSARVERVEFRGDQSVAVVRSGNLRFSVRIRPSKSLEAGADVVVAIDWSRVIAFDPISGLRLDSASPHAEPGERTLRA